VPATRAACHRLNEHHTRRAVAGALPPGLRPHLGDDLGLLTNAIRHGTADAATDLVELILWPADGHYWLAVSDPGTGGRGPVLTHPGTDAESGRGLLLVDHLATAWTIRPRPTRGTSVIAGLRVPGCDRV
jgi:hypothetical protein